MNSAKILITEDEVLIAREIEMTLQEMGYVVAGIASDGQTALEQVAKTKPDLVLMDIVIPGDVDGIETADQIRVRFQIPVVFLTAYADADTLQRAKITEPFGYVLKPFQPQELHSAIQIALVRHRAERLKLETLRHNISTSLPHEINTPLHSILGFTEVMLRHYDTMSKSDALETLLCIQSAATRLQKVCQNFLFYARVEVLASDPTHLMELRLAETPATQDVIEIQSSKKAREFDRSMDLKLNLQALTARIAEVYLSKIAEELLDNALRFSEPGTPVQVTSYANGQDFCLSITDQGRGMSQAQIAQSGAYMQFDRSTFEQQGLGLGLALVRRLITLHGGECEIDSVVGEGTTVTVRLPMTLG